MKTQITPDKFLFYIGSFTGPYEEYRLDDDWLRYRVNNEGCPPHMCQDGGAALIIAEKQMTEHDWAALWARLDEQRCDFWNWRKTYRDPDIMDGTQWELKSRMGGRYVKSYGCNAFPGGGKKNSEFNKFVEALEWVLGINAGVK
jgi:hypothetical protein